MTLEQFETKFSLGQTVITSNAQSRLTNADVLTALKRHTARDWGEVCEDDRIENELSLREGFRLLSVYHSEAGEKSWSITETDHSVTTVLLPSDY